MNKPKKYDDKRIKALLNPNLKKEKVPRQVFVSDEVKQKLGINSPYNFFEVEVDQQSVFEEVEEVMNNFSGEERKNDA
jgi:hypothetical protein|nr:MAG TPA: hypothetical protein [Caudoviricetes sp.]